MKGGDVSDHEAQPLDWEKPFEKLMEEGEIV
jgi:hypothetical protein